MKATSTRVNSKDDFVSRSDVFDFGTNFTNDAGPYLAVAVSIVVILRWGCNARTFVAQNDGKGRRNLPMKYS